MDLLMAVASGLAFALPGLNPDALGGLCCLLVSDPLSVIEIG